MPDDPAAEDAELAAVLAEIDAELAERAAARAPAPKRRGRPPKPRETTFTQEYIGESDVSTRCRVTLRTVQRWRSTGKGPPFCRINRLIVYRLSDYKAWAAARKSSPRLARRRMNRPVPNKPAMENHGAR